MSIPYATSQKSVESLEVSSWSLERGQLSMNLCGEASPMEGKIELVENFGRERRWYFPSNAGAT